MAVTSHVYPKNLVSILNGTISLTTASFSMGLCTGSASTWGSTEWAYQYVSDVTGAYTEVTSSGYARQALAGMALTVETGGSSPFVKWTVTSPVSFGSSITLAAASAFIYNTTGANDAAHPVIAIVDFGGTVTSTSGSWTFTEDATNGLIAVTAS